MIQLRDYQRHAVDQAKEIMKVKHMVYLAGQLRTGKNFMSMMISNEMGWQRVCFLTKLNAIPDVKKDYHDIALPFKKFTITNFDQIKNLKPEYDGFIIDEAHSFGQFPKPSKRTEMLRELIGFHPVILMSGTPSPETPTQLYYQFRLTEYGPWLEYRNFYKWAHQYVDIKEKIINGRRINDYKKAKTEKIEADISPYFVRVTQQQAGFTSFVEEEILTVPIDKRMYQLMDVLKKDKVYRMKSTGDTIVADTPVRLQSLFHQISSGTIKVGDRRITLDESKAWFIKSRFAGQKIGIFYKFIQEGEVLRKVFHNWTSDHQEFNQRNDLIYIKQCVSGREGVNLSTADCIVAYNIDFSATTYWQMRARMQTMDRKKSSKLYWIFSENGIERFVYRAVTKKKNFTKSYFDQALRQWSPHYNPKLFET